jgi:hypothetical protein
MLLTKPVNLYAYERPEVQAMTPDCRYLNLYAAK